MAKSLKQRLENDENAWLKFMGEFGDLARLLRDTKSEEARTRRVMLKTIHILEERIKKLEEKFNVS